MSWFPRKIYLKSRFMVATSLLLFVLMVIIILLVGDRFTQSIKQEAQARGLAVAQSIAAVSTNALLTYNYVTLEQNAERAGQGTDIVYVIILDKEKKVAAFSGHSSRQGNYLDDPFSSRALAATKPFVQSVLWEETGERVLDITVPVFIAGYEMKWGTVRVGLSLERMYRQIRRTQLVLVGIGTVALILGIAGAHVMASRITQPLGQLANATIAAAGGDLDQRLDIHTRDEVEDLANSFNTMIREILDQRVQLEQRLDQILELKAYNDIVLASMTNGLITLDLESRIVSANGAAESILRLEGKPWQGIRFYELWPEDNPFVRLLEKCLLNQTACRNKEISLDTGESEQRTLMVSTSFLEAGRGGKMGLLVVLNDVTEVKALEARMRQSDRLAALGTLSAGLAHEIRNPLSAIKTFVQLLPRKLSNPAFFDKFQTTVPRELNRINDLIESLLELARPPKLEFRMISVSGCLSQVEDLYRDKLEAANITLEIREKDSVPELWADREHLVRALSNIVVNGLEAMPHGGKLTVTAEDLAGGVLLRFTDTGVGMDEATKDKIFNPFFTTKDTGTGLGLAMTHKIIQEHSGVIEVDSVVGKGTTFVLKFPGVQG
jgi:nitrogen fixation/metabolism regulation signal transduction histidine kinase